MSRLSRLKWFFRIFHIIFVDGISSLFPYTSEPANKRASDYRTNTNSAATATYLNMNKNVDKQWPQRSAQLTQWTMASDDRAQRSRLQIASATTTTEEQYSNVVWPYSCISSFRFLLSTRHSCPFVASIRPFCFGRKYARLSDTATQTVNYVCISFWPKIECEIHFIHFSIAMKEEREF